MLERILVAIDGSPQSHKALEVASEMAERFSSKMIVLHVLEEGEPSAELRQAVEAEHLVTPPPVIMTRSSRPSVGLNGLPLTSVPTTSCR